MIRRLKIQKNLIFKNKEENVLKQKPKHKKSSSIKAGFLYVKIFSKFFGKENTFANENIRVSNSTENG